MARFETLQAWLDWQETLHPLKIDLGLERIARVASRLGLLSPAYTVISVAGTNGKGSCVALLEAVLRSAGYRVGSYTSPHLLRYNERIRLDGQEAGDAALCAAFQLVEDAREEVSLSYFEFGTLAALQIFHNTSLDVVVLEVGLGGRLDAVNILDPDVALVTSIGIDHVQWLGDNRESIGREKAGIFRPGRPAICCDPDPPHSLAQTARQLDACWLLLGEHFSYHAAGGSWRWQGVSRHCEDLPLPALAGRHQLRNAAGVLMALETLGDRHPVTDHAIRHGLRTVALPARCQFVPGPVEKVLDVAHNPDSARCLVEQLEAHPHAGKTHLVLGMLKDKDVGTFARILQHAVDYWHLADLQGERGLSAEALSARLRAAGITGAMHCHRSVAEACRQALGHAVAGDRLIICGSFHTVAAAMETEV